MTEKRFVKYDGNTIVDLKLVKSWVISNGDVDLLINLLNDDKITEKQLSLGVENFQILYEQYKDALKIIKNLKEENKQLKEKNRELREELLELIDATSDNRPNKKGFAGNGRFA